MLLQVPVPPTPPVPPSLPAPDIIIGGGVNTETLIISLVAACVIVGFVVLGPVGRAIADGIRHLLGARKGAESAELERMREEVAALQHRVAELEERQDFAERLLAQARERGLLAGPSPE